MLNSIKINISDMPQRTSSLLMVRPATFGFNPSTAGSNSFQSKDSTFSTEEIQTKALVEFDEFVEVLQQNYVEVMVIEDTITPAKPDAIFPNNWISMGHNGEITLFPMAAKNRRLERRLDVTERLSQHFEVAAITDLSHHENDSKYLEGTGSMVFDHLNKLAYACISDRTHPLLFEQFCTSINYYPLSFEAIDEGKKSIYHTNVMMSVGSRVAVICAESIVKKTERDKVIESLKSTRHEVIMISFGQMNQFACNTLEVINSKGDNLLVMSTQAFSSLTADQIKRIEKHLRIIHSPLYTIEKTGGGSARCMMAEIFLPPLKNKR